MAGGDASYWGHVASHGHRASVPRVTADDPPAGGIRSPGDEASRRAGRASFAMSCADEGRSASAGTLLRCRLLAARRRRKKRRPTASPWPAGQPGGGRSNAPTFPALAQAAWMKSPATRDDSPPGGNASQHKKRKKAGHFYGGLPLPTMDRSLAHIEALRLSLSLSPRVMGNQSLERRERRKRPSTAASDCESTL